EFVHVIFIPERGVDRSGGLGNAGGLASVLGIQEVGDQPTDSGGSYGDGGQNIFETVGCGFVEGVGSFSRTEYRREKRREVVRAAPERWGREPAAGDREHCENYQGAEHAPGRFVDVDVMFVVALLTVKGEEDQAEHVKRSHQCGEQAET